MELLKPIENIGRLVITGLVALGAGLLMLWDALMGVTQIKKRTWYRIVAQMAVVGNDSLPIVVVTLFFGGLVFGLHIAHLLVLYGGSTFIGSAVTIAMARELAPTLTGVVVAARIGSSFAAELGSMKITNQVDALRALAVNPVRYLVTPRLLACIIMLPLLTVFANLTGSVGGLLISVTDGGISAHTFLQSAEKFLQMKDVFGGLLKTIVFGIIITIVSCTAGLKAEGGATGVGKATTIAVVWSIVLMYATNFVMSWMIYTLWK
ncbi:MAG: ABC transporter permease [bacterium]